MQQTTDRIGKCRNLRILKGAYNDESDEKENDAVGAYAPSGRF